MNDWLPPIVTTGLFGFALWLARNLIATRLTKSVEHEFNEKLEALRAELRGKEEVLKADLRSKENEIAALRSGAMTAMSSRQIALDTRRLEAVDQLWSAVTAVAGAKWISAFMAITKFEAVAEEATRNVKVREMFNLMGSPFDLTKIDLSGGAKARPFVSPMAWALFSAHQAIAMQAVAKLNIIKSGIGKDALDTSAVVKLAKAALPHRTGYIDTYGDAGLHYLLEELEEALLGAMREMLSEGDSYRANVETSCGDCKALNRIDGNAISSADQVTALEELNFNCSFFNAILGDGEIVGVAFDTDELASSVCTSQTCRPRSHRVVEHRTALSSVGTDQVLHQGNGLLCWV